MIKITTGSAASPWDHISPSPAPIRASGYSVKSSSSKHGARSHELTFSSESSQSFEVYCFYKYLFVVNLGDFGIRSFVCFGCVNDECLVCRVEKQITLIQLKNTNMRLVKACV